MTPWTVATLVFVALLASGEALASLERTSPPSAAAPASQQQRSRGGVGGRAEALGPASPPSDLGLAQGRVAEVAASEGDDVGLGRRLARSLRGIFGIGRQSAPNAAAASSENTTNTTGHLLANATPAAPTNSTPPSSQIAKGVVETLPMAKLALGDDDTDANVTASAADQANGTSTANSTADSATNFTANSSTGAATNGTGSDEVNGTAVVRANATVTSQVAALVNGTALPMAKLALGSGSGDDQGGQGRGGGSPAVTNRTTTNSTAANSTYEGAATNSTAAVKVERRELELEKEVASLKEKLATDEKQMAAAKSLTGPVVVVVPGKGGMEKAQVAAVAQVVEAANNASMKSLATMASKEQSTNKASNSTTAQTHSPTDVHQRAEKLFGVVAPKLSLISMGSMDPARAAVEAEGRTHKAAGATADISAGQPPAVLGLWGRLRSRLGGLLGSLWGSEAAAALTNEPSPPRKLERKDTEKKLKVASRHRRAGPLLFLRQLRL